MHDEWHQDGEFGEAAQWRRPLIVLAEVVPEPPSAAPAPPRAYRRRVWLPLLLFVATCLSTLLEGGWVYAVAVMTILLCHEMGHFIQAWRYGVYASFPYFIPVPYISPFGTLGAVIAMEAKRGDRRALFDIGITGPLAGLVPTLICTIIGLHLSQPRLSVGQHEPMLFGTPLLFDWLADWFAKPVPPGYVLTAHPLAFAGWVGLFITSLNLMPIGQLDGGHVLYALLKRRAHWIARGLLTAAVLTVSILMFWIPELGGWVLMLLLLIFVVRPDHPPTADDDAPLGWVRIVLGWLVLAFIPLGFTPVPIIFPR
jgi:membrane-associated protease RseP (regulator of RpoE activity)